MRQRVKAVVQLRNFPKLLRLEAALLVEELETPAVVVDLDVVERNLSRMADYCAGKNLQSATTQQNPQDTRVGEMATGKRSMRNNRCENW